jgi:hypothetical protein
MGRPRSGGVSLFLSARQGSPKGLATSPSNRSLLENGVMLVLTCDSAGLDMAATERALESIPPTGGC